MKKSLHESLSEEATKIPGGKFTEPKGAFKNWLNSAEGKTALERGIKDEMEEHTTDHGVARQIAIDHLKLDRKHYEKVAKAGLDEGLWDNKQEFHHDGTDDLEDTAHDDLDIAIAALKDPERAKRQAIRNPSATSHLIAALNNAVNKASGILKAIPKAVPRQQQQPVTVEAAMAFGGSTAVGGNPGDKGSGVPVMQPHAGQKMKFCGGRLKMGKPGKGSTTPDASTGQKSAFAKGVL